MATFCLQVEGYTTQDRCDILLYNTRVSLYIVQWSSIRSWTFTIYWKFTISIGQLRTGRVLCLVGSLRYREKKNPCFNAIWNCMKVYFTWEKCTQSAYSESLHCKVCALIHGCLNAHYVQRTRVSSCFINAILYCKQLYFTIEKCIQCAYNVRLNCTECRLKHGCIIPRYRSDPALYNAVPAAKMIPCNSMFSMVAFQAAFLIAV